MEPTETYTITMTAKIVGKYIIMDSKSIKTTKEFTKNNDSYKYKETQIIEKEEEKYTIKTLKRTKRFRKNQGNSKYH